MVRCSLCVVVTALSLSPASAQTLFGAADMLDALPQTVPLGEARAIALVPGGRGSNPQGVLFVKGEAEWGDPEFVLLRGAVPPGVRETPDYVLVFRARRSVERVRTGDGCLDSDVLIYTLRAGELVPVTFDGASLRKSGLLAGAPDRKSATELKAKLTQLTAPKRAAEPKQPVTVDWAALAEHREVFMGGFAALGAWLAMMKRRQR